MPKSYTIPEHLRPILAHAERLLAEGQGNTSVHFKFTCANCGKRQIFQEPNTFYPKGECEECKHVSSLLDPKADVNFVLIIARPGVVLPSRES